MNVLVIGAGASGIAAARELALAGFQTTVIEARNRIGGRIWTTRDPGLPGPLELGAEFVHGRAGCTFSLIDQFGLNAYEVPDQHLFGESGQYSELPDFWDRIDKALGIEPGTADMSFAETQKRRFWRRLFHRGDQALAQAFVEGFHAADPALISQRALARETQASQELEGSVSYRLFEGYGTLLDHLEKSIPRSRIEFILGTPITRIEWERGRVQVESAHGEHFVANALVLTLPPGPLAGIDIHPLFPAQTLKALQCVSTGAVAKVIFRFREGVLKKTAAQRASFLQLPNNRFFPTWWTSAPFDWHTLTGWTGGRAAAELSLLSPADLRPVAERSLARVLGFAPQSLADHVVRFHFHNWQTDPFSQGAYGYLKVGGADAPQYLVKPIEDTVFLAGEATEAVGINGTVEGALQSGIRAARQLVQVLDRRKRIDVPWDVVTEHQRRDFRLRRPRKVAKIHRR